MANANFQDRSWIFRQLGGEKKTLTLAGWSAPHGRPRQKAVVRDGIQLRHRSVRYPGSNQPPTRHLFGVTYHDLSLEGRFRDSDLGYGGAIAMKETLKQFVKDQQRLDISWGPWLHVTGFIEEFDPGMESESEIEWKLKILVDQDNTQISQVNPNKSKSPGQTVAEIELKKDLLVKIATHKATKGVQTNVLDFLDDIASLVAGTVGQLVNLVNSIADTEQGMANAAKKVIAGVHQSKTAMLALIDTVECAEQDIFYIRDSAKDVIDFNAYKTAAITEAYIALALLSDLEKQATSAQKGDAALSIHAQHGDTWESISTKVFGGPGYADDIKKANNARFGTKPVAGQIITIPFV